MDQHRSQVDLVAALEAAETEAKKTGVLNIRRVLRIATEECQFPELGVVWQDTLEPDSNGIQLCEDDDCVDPQATGHALVHAAASGQFHCVQALRHLQANKYSGSFLTGRFCAYAILKAVEQGHRQVVKELLKPVDSASAALMGYSIATKYMSGHYPYVTEPIQGVSIEWGKKMSLAFSMLPKAVPNLLPSGSWELQGPNGCSPSVDEAIRAVYKTYFLWRTTLIAAANDKAETMQEILGEIVQQNAELKAAAQDKGEAKKLMSTRTKLESLMYLLVEELSAVQKKDGILYSLWTFIPRGSPNAPSPLAIRPHPKAAGTHCTAQAQGGLWEVQVEIPVMMMPLEAGYDEEDIYKRMKMLDPIFSQRVRANVLIVCEVAKLPNCLQVTVGIKHVRMKVENSIWEEQRIGHFPCHFSVSVTPETDEGGSCTMSNSSSNVGYKIGVGERIGGTVGVAVIANAVSGVTARMGFGANVAKSTNTTMKSTPWRFEQIQVSNDRGGSFVWNLQGMREMDFSRLNPVRLSESTSIWKFGRRIPVNPLTQLPFTSEGGINFTGTSHDDTLTWRLPKEMEGTSLKWLIEGRFHCTYTTTKFWETREATFAGEIVETLKALEDKKDKDKKGKGDDEEDGKKEKKKDKDKDKKEKGGDGEGDGEKKKKKDKKEKGGDDEDDGEKKKKKDKDKDKTKKSENEDEDDGVPVKKSKKKAVEDDEDEEAPVVKTKNKKKSVEEYEDEEDVPVKKLKKKKLVEDEDEDDVSVKKTKKKKPVEEDDEDEVPVKKLKKKIAVEDEDEDVPVKKPKKKIAAEDEEEDDVSAKKPKKKKPVEEDDDEDELPVEKTKKKVAVEEVDDEEDKPVRKPKKKKPVEDDEDEDDVKKTKKKVQVDEEDEEPEVPVKKTKVKKAVVVEEDDEEDYVPKKKMGKKKVVKDDDDDMEDAPQVKQKGGKKVGLEDEDEDHASLKKSKKKTQVEDDEEYVVKKGKKDKKVANKDDQDDGDDVEWDSTSDKMRGLKVTQREVGLPLPPGRR